MLWSFPITARLDASDRQDQLCKPDRRNAREGIRRNIRNLFPRLDNRDDRSRGRLYLCLPIQRLSTFSNRAICETRTKRNRNHRVANYAPRCILGIVVSTKECCFCYPPTSSVRDRWLTLVAVVTGCSRSATFGAHDLGAHACTIFGVPIRELPHTDSICGHHRIFNGPTFAGQPSVRDARGRLDTFHLYRPNAMEQ